MSRTSMRVILLVLALGLLSGCGNRREMMQKASDAKTRMVLLEQKVENQQKQIDALKKEVDTLREK